MSDEGQGTSQETSVVGEFKDGNLEIVEVINDKDSVNDEEETEILTYETDSDQLRMYPNVSSMQVVGESGKNNVLDLLNMTLIKCYSEDGESYRLVSSNSECEDSETITCILSNEESDGQEEQFMVVDDNNLYLQSDYTENNEIETPTTESINQQPSPQWILEKAKAYQQSKTLLASLQRRDRKGRRRKGELPPPHELLTSPTFKLYLYSCKMCNFKCNAIKELQTHKAAEHSSGNSNRGRNSSIALQCPKCPYKSHTHGQLAKHLNQNHTNKEFSYSEAINLDTDEVNNADVLVCGACGFESSSKEDFRTHIQEEHGATAI